MIMVALWFVSCLILREMPLLVGVGYIQKATFYSQFAKCSFLEGHEIYT